MTLLDASRTTVLTADTPPAAGGGTVLVLAVLLTLGYLAACAMWPYRACRRCGGAARFLSPTGRAWRRCPTCSGTGAKLRFGRRVWNVAARYRHARQAQRTRERRYGPGGERP